MNFEKALKAVKQGHLAVRTGWNGANMFIFLVKGSQFQVNRAPLMEIFPAGTEIEYCPHIDMRTADGSIVPWLASQSDLLAVDWRIVEVDEDSLATTLIFTEKERGPVMEIAGVSYSLYQKNYGQPMRPYLPGECMDGISISEGDTLELGGMIGVNPSDPMDRWYISKDYFNSYYQEVE